jgi:predicted RNase H-like nuclease (RuvC/YqgF family)
MDPVTVIVYAFILFAAAGEEIKENDAEIAALETRVEQLEDTTKTHQKTILSLSGAHSAHAARSNLKDNQHDSQIEANQSTTERLQKRVDFLDNKVIELHN